MYILWILKNHHTLWGYHLPFDSFEHLLWLTFNFKVALWIVISEGSLNVFSLMCYRNFSMKKGRFCMPLSFSFFWKKDRLALLSSIVSLVQFVTSNLQFLSTWFHVIVKIIDILALYSNVNDIIILSCNGSYLNTNVFFFLQEEMACQQTAFLGQQEYETGG